ncbi:GNAT superfamily N-acetyltransferase [Chitinivorax tropicus]|uniref:GNAT superfamily N-acetyltransferase n=1 Tax=Chitinivorax tropicus TaxID=714531 RepID=A0A840MDU9_9PROT|nr:GNAT superfamily N-acetyltransferase [Chitinivorax tropicus]
MFLTQYGKGWLAEVDKTVVGFAIIDLLGNNIWALFVHPDFEKRGIGKTLHDAMLNWYFEQTAVAIWLSTTPQTRAEQFYRQAGWTAAGLTRTGEVRFELTREAWVSLNHVVK